MFVTFIVAVLCWLCIGSCVFVVMLWGCVVCVEVWRLRLRSSCGGEDQEGGRREKSSDDV